MGKTKTSILVDEALWRRFRVEVERRFRGRRASVPPVSSVVEDLVRGWLEGLHRARVPIYEVAYLASLEPRVLYRYARVNPDLAFKILQARPQPFLRLIASDFTPRSPEEAKRQGLDHYYVVGEDMVNVYWYDGWDKEWFQGGDVYYFIARNSGSPYFNPWILEVLLGEGWPEATAARHLGLEEECIDQYPTFSLRDPEGWQRLLELLGGLVEAGVGPEKTYIRERDCDAYRLTEQAMASRGEYVNALRFLTLLSSWITSSPHGAPL